MERKGGCCLAPRYAAGGQPQPGAAWQMGKVMLKFRPIAPKPAAMAPVPSPAPAPAAAAGRGKRKAAVGAGGGRRGRKPKKAATVAPVPAPAVAPPAMAAALEVGCGKESEEKKSLSSRSSSSSGTTSVDSSPPPPQAKQQLPATLPLMPVSPFEEKAAASAAAAAEEPAPVAASLVAAPAPAPAAAAQRPVAPRPPCPAPAPASWVTVEEVTATWRDGEATSAAAACASGADEAPAFVSDQWGSVTWANAAFARAMSVPAGADAAPVGLAGALPAWGTCAGFTCRVRVARHASPRRTAGGGGGGGCCGSSVVAPCDVWRLDAAGCYLWRLDLQAALTLGGLL